MNAIKIRGSNQLPRLKVRIGVIPTLVQKAKTQYTRKEKHKTGD